MTLLSEIEAFCSEHQMAESQFGVLALNDKNLVRDLRDERDLRLSTVEKVRCFMAQYSPAQDRAA